MDRPHNTSLDTSSALVELVVRKWATSNVKRVDQGGRFVYVKQYVEQPDQDVTLDVIRRRTARELGLFHRMALSRLPHWRLGVVRLVEGDAHSGTIITEEIGGRPIRDLIFRPYCGSVNRESLLVFYLAGKWLRWFQSLPTYPGDETPCSDNDPIDTVEYCELRIQKILALGYGWPTDPIRLSISNRLRQLVARSSSDDLRLVWAHGDYGPQNLHWNGGKLTPLDFGSTSLSYPLLDVTYLIHRLEMLRVYFPWRRWPIEAWKLAFLRGYGRSDAEQSPMYQAMMIRHLHCRLKTYVRRPPLNLKQCIHNAWTRRRVRSKLLRLVRGT